MHSNTTRHLHNCHTLYAWISLLLISAALSAQPAGSVTERIKARVEQIRAGQAVEIGGEAVSSMIVLPALYEQRGYTPIWSNAQSVRQLLAAIRSINEDGLEPGDYHLAALEDLNLKKQEGAPDAALAADLDVMLTDSLIRLGYQLSFGKVDPEALDPNWNMQRYIEDLDSVLALVASIEQGEVDRLIESFRPQADIYQGLMAALAEYRGIRSQGGWQPVADGPALKPGMSDPRVISLRKRMVITGDMPGQDLQSAEFDTAVEAGVKQFQQRHGLSADGVAGKATLAEMNVPVQARIDQIRANLERARWVLRNLPETFVLADIAGFKVSYFRDGEVLWQTRAQVGKPYRTTPVFKSSMTYLDVNPTWTVPPTILSKDVLPAIKRDPGYLAKKNMRVLDRSGKTVDPGSIDWSKHPGAGFPYVIRQDPGPSNALGRIKFMFPNKHAVYLHDTPSKSLFNRTERAFSSGCIRIENPFEFAELLLKNDPNWNRDKILETVDSMQTTTIRLSEPVTVILLYWTVTIGGDDRVIFKKDIYDRDPPIIRGLAADFRFRKGAIIRN